MKEKQNSSEVAKQKRLKNYEIRRANMLERGFTEHIGTISILKANIMAFVTAGPFAILAVVIYYYVWGEISFHFDLSESIYFLCAILISLPIHEFIHGFTWSFFCQNKWKSIHFGVMKETLTPYCHCEEPLRFGSYLIGSLMPLLILGFGISILGIALHSSVLLATGALNMLSAGGDTTIACMLLKYHKCEILDHPTECGFVAYCKEV